MRWGGRFTHEKLDIRSSSPTRISANLAHQFYIPFAGVFWHFIPAFNMDAI
jgi:hypothetical protein